MDTCEYNPKYPKIYLLTHRWSDKLAAEEYILTVLEEFPNGERRRVREVIGDLEWSKRIAAHYKTIVKEDN